MSDARHDILLRSARDRVIDLLGIGDTYPLTDLNLVADQLKVPFGGTAKIPVEQAQANVSYQLCDSDGTPLGEAFGGDGKDETLVVETPPILADVTMTFRIRAAKQPSASATLESVLLDEEARVEVGVDTSLETEILAAPPLDRTKTDPQPSDPRIVAYGDEVNVLVERTQEGVLYSLVLDEIDVGKPKLGNGEDIELSTGEVYEDTRIQICAKKARLHDDDLDREDAHLLDRRLYLKVMANSSLAVTIAPPSVVNYGHVAVVTIRDSQESVRYRAYVHTLLDNEFVHDDPGDKTILRVADKPDVKVLLPPPLPSPDQWSTPDGYGAVGEDAVKGTGGDLPITVASLEDDAIVIVQAIKAHRVDEEDPESDKTIASEIRIAQPAVVLVRPDPMRLLTLQDLASETTSDEMLQVQVSGGQPGVFYHFRPAPSGEELPQPAYFHKRGHQDPSQNKGVGQLGISIDFAIAADSEDDPGADPATNSPRDPILDITSTALGSPFSVRAVKASTGVDTDMDQEVVVVSGSASGSDPPDPT